MNILSKQIKGLTLTELLVASAVIIIVMLGVVSISISMNKFSSQTGRIGRVAANLDSAMVAITKDASLSVGDATNSGIWTRSNGTQRAICFRQDIPQTAENYNDDTYVCYAHGRSNTIYRCEVANIVGFTVCPQPAQFILQLTTSDFFDMSSWSAYMTINLSTAYDSKAPCDVVSNPCLSLSTQISPLAHGK